MIYIALQFDPIKYRFSMKSLISSFADIGYRLEKSEQYGYWYVVCGDGSSCTYLPSMAFSLLKQSGLRYGVGYDYSTGRLFIRFYRLWHTEKGFRLESV